MFVRGGKSIFRQNVPGHVLLGTGMQEAIHVCLYLQACSKMLCKVLQLFEASQLLSDLATVI